MANELKILDELLNSINGGYGKSYKKILGTYNYGDFSLIIDHVPDDPSQHSSRLRVRIPLNLAKFPENVLFQPVVLLQPASYPENVL